MAGLTRNSGARTGYLPEWPHPDLTLGPYYGMNNPTANEIFQPGFEGGAAGSSVRIHTSGLTSFTAKHFDKDGNASSSGSWNGGTGLSITQANGGNSNPDRWCSTYMDATDQMLYMLFNDSSTSPHTLYFSKVNASGTVTTIGNAQLGNAGIHNQWYASSFMGRLMRPGGDGSGDFMIYHTGGAGGNSASAVPYRGAKITISASDGSLSYADMFPSTYGTPIYIYTPHFGPTANNIVGGIYDCWTGASTGFNAYSAKGSLANLTTGKASNYVNYGNPIVNGCPFTTGYQFIVVENRGKYVIGTYGGSGTIYGPSMFDVDEIHNFIDEMAVYHGIL
tara:strand:+ start:51 stop:1055 length:1005 start_codon:yes stop_codon:yes gene_type:complete